jgi:phytoene synthase
MPQRFMSETRADPADLAACRALLRDGSKTFFAASLLLPARVFEPAAVLYAFCRLADDAVDVDGTPLATLQVRLRRAYDGCPLPIPADRAFAAVVARYGIPAALPEALLEGLEWDAAGRRYEDLSDLYDYAARVAGTVGAMMAMLMGVRAPEVVARACDLGVAMQLSNIARDVGEDARAGRVYLPLSWLREAGIDPDAWLAAPVFSEALAGVVARLLAEAEALYRRALPGIGRLPLCCRPGIGAARLMYAEIGRQLARDGLDPVGRRTVVPTRRKLALLGRSIAGALHRAPLHPLPPLDAVRFLVDAVAEAPAPLPPPVPVAPPRGVDGRIAWVVDLFLRLDAQHQLGS